MRAKPAVNEEVVDMNDEVDQSPRSSSLGPLLVAQTSHPQPESHPAYTVYNYSTQHRTGLSRV